MRKILKDIPRMFWPMVIPCYIVLWLGSQVFWWGPLIILASILAILIH